VVYVNNGGKWLHLYGWSAQPSGKLKEITWREAFTSHYRIDAVYFCTEVLKAPLQPELAGEHPALGDKIILGMRLRVSQLGPVANQLVSRMVAYSPLCA
jgi:hypothetical protein